MIYLMLENKNSEYQKNIVNFFKSKIKNNPKNLNIQYKIIYNNKHIFESNISEINENDIILWSAFVAYHNLEIVKMFQNSIVILEKPTVLIQKISELNPVNESMAVNHVFYLMYISDKQDITNNDWKMIVQEENYLITIDNLLDLISDDKTNINPETTSDIFKEIVDISNMLSLTQIRLK